MGSEGGHVFGDPGGKYAALLLPSAPGRRAKQPKKMFKQNAHFSTKPQEYFSVLNTPKPHLCLCSVNGDLKFLTHVALGRTP